VPVNTDEAAAQKMLADTQTELETLREPPAEGAERGEFPPEIQRRLDASEAESAKEEGYANALEEAGNCLAELGLTL
jgi:hypothetical protein